MTQPRNVDKMVNIYFFENSFTSWGYFPSMANNWIVMRNAHLTNGSTLSHEIGHYLSLYHTHETAFGAELVDGSNCATAGDLICDTAADPKLSSLVDSSCTYIGTATDANGDTYDPDPRNLMSYSRKECRDVFSRDQAERMTFAFLHERLGLRRSVSDINGDGLGDIAFHKPIAGSSWRTVPMLLSGGDGTWTAHNTSAPTWAHQEGAIAIR